MSNDFKELNDQLKTSVITLLHDWLPGGNVLGREYSCGDLSGSKGKSLRVNIETTLWKDFATGDAGGDLISLYAKIKNIGNFEAYRYLSGIQGVSVSSPNEFNSGFPKKLDTASIPPKNHEPPAFKLSGVQATKYWAYKNQDGLVIFYIARFDMVDVETRKPCKEFRPYTWIGGTWKNKAFPSPRPLYGLEFLNQFPDRPILIVEGEKCVDAARTILGHVYNVITWPGGSNATDKVDWTPIYGKDIFIWPDNDEPGVEASLKIISKLSRNTKSIKILEVQKATPPMPNSWDAADAIDDKWDFKRFKDFAKPLVVICPEYQAPEKSGPVEKQKTPAESAKEMRNLADYSIHIEVGFSLSNGSQIPFSNNENCEIFLDYFEGKAFKIWYDEFCASVFIRWRTQETEEWENERKWEDEDDTTILVLAQKVARLRSARHDQMVRAIQCHAKKHRRNEPKEWMNSLKWDGVSRVPLFFSDYMGAEETAYTSTVAQNFWVSIVARVMNPGCKVDNMVVLEGIQGTRKSTALGIIGGKWFTECDEKMGTKDFYQKIQGRLIVEIGELGSLGADVETVKNTLSQKIDNFRPSYGRNVKEFKRQCVFVGTTNKDDYLKDPTGARRFWPVKTNKIDHKGIEDDREHLFAEAVHLYKQGESWWNVPEDEAKEQQALRSETDEWEAAIHDYLYKSDMATILDILKTAIGKPTADIQWRDQSRVSAILKQSGWRKAKRRKIGGILQPNEWERIKSLYNHGPEETRVTAQLNIPATPPMTGDYQSPDEFI